MPVELTVQLDFRVFSAQDAETACSRLLAAGFDVDDPSIRAEHVRRFEAVLREHGDTRSYVWPSDTHVVSVTIPVSVDADADDEATSLAVDLAVAKLDAATAPIERDPEVQWQIGRLDSIFRPS